MAEASFGESAQFNNVATTSSKGLRDPCTTLHRGTTSELTKIARVLVRFDHIASRIARVHITLSLPRGEQKRHNPIE